LFQLDASRILEITVESLNKLEETIKRLGDYQGVRVGKLKKKNDQRTIDQACNEMID